MDFDFDDKTTELRERLLTFMADRIVPSEPVFHEQLGQLEDRWAWSTVPVLQELRAEARELGLWNLFLPGRARRQPRAHQPPVRAARRDHRPQRPPRAGRAQLRGPRHRQHGGALALRHRRAEGALAPAAAGRRDPLGVRDDRARRRVVGRHQHRDPDRARRRRVRHQRPQVVDHRRDEPRGRDHDRDGQDRPERVAAPPAEPGAGPPRHPRRRGRARHGGLRVRRPRARRPRRAGVPRRPGAGLEPDRRGGRGLRDRPGPARPRPDPPLHARHRHRRGRDRADVPAGVVAGRFRPAARRPGRHPRLDRRVAGARSSSCGCWCSRPRG